MLQFELFKDAVHHLWRQHELGGGERCIVPCYYHLHDLSTRETISLSRNALNNIMIDAFHPDQLFASEDAPGIPVKELQFLHLCFRRLAILDKIVVEHRLSLVLGGFVEVDDFVDSIVHGGIELVGRVCRQHDDHFVGGRTRPVQERVDGVTHVFGHVEVATVPEERVRLVDEENHAIRLVLCPIKQLVELCDSIFAQRRDV